jgi:hypothetical protein
MTTNHGQIELKVPSEREAQDNSCTFCTRRDPVKVLMESSSPMRNLRVAICEHCSKRLEKLIIS